MYFNEVILNYFFQFFAKAKAFEDKDGHAIDSLYRHP